MQSANGKHLFYYVLLYRREKSAVVEKRTANWKGGNLILVSGLVYEQQGEEAGNLNKNNGVLIAIKLNEDRKVWVGSQNTAEVKRKSS